MARTQEVFLQGKVKWVHTKRLDKYGKWKAVLYPNEESLTKVRELIEEGIQNELNKDDDGYFITFSRLPEKSDRTGRKYSLTPVEVVDKDGRGFDGYVGNGSDCTLKLEVYGGKRPGGIGGEYKAARLAGIRVDNLVPYEPDISSDNSRVVGQVKGLREQPQQVQGW